MPSSAAHQPSTPTASCACASPRSSWIPSPPRLLLLAIGAMALAHLVLPGAGLRPPAWRLLGLVPLGAGAALNLLADRAFATAGTTVKPLLPSTSLVTGGVFRLTRNPMYAGMVFLLVGLWLALGSLLPGLVVVAFALLIERYYVCPEEEKLAREFGAAYAAYRSRVRRWL